MLRQEAGILRDVLAVPANSREKDLITKGSLLYCDFLEKLYAANVLEAMKAEDEAEEPNLREEEL